VSKLASEVLALHLLQLLEMLSQSPAFSSFEFGLPSEQ